MRATSRTALLTLLLSAAGTLQAQAPADQPTIYGRGRDTCAQWLTARTDATAADRAAHLASISWVTGYLSAMSRVLLSQGIPMARTTPKEAAAWIDKYCRLDSTDTLEMAAFMFTSTLSERVP